MKSISGKRLCKVVERKGWVLKRVTGSHHIYAKAGVEKILSIPVHRSRFESGNLESVNESCSVIRRRFALAIFKNCLNVRKPHLRS
ncbi:type II toxin-antitoxin system HicA family toxin [Lusitaniella coriacea LEGE 07167]